MTVLRVVDRFVKDVQLVVVNAGVVESVNRSG